MKNLQLLLLCTLLSFLSCDKDDPKTVISGHVLTFGTEDPVFDAKLVLYGGTPDGNVSNPGSNLTRIDSVYTDAAGFYEFTFDGGAYPILDVVAEKESYFSQSVQQGLISGGQNVANILLEPFAWIKFHLKNAMPAANSDAIEVWGPWKAGSTLFTGADIDEFFLVNVAGNKESNIHWNVLGSGNINQDYLYCPAQDTILFEIFY